MGDCLMGVEGAAETRREKGGRVAAFSAEDGELLVRGLADLLGSLAAAHRWLVCLCPA